MSLKKTARLSSSLSQQALSLMGPRSLDLLWFFLSPTGLLLIPGLFHDYGYRYDQLWHLDTKGNISPFPKPPKNGKWLLGQPVLRNRKAGERILVTRRACVGGRYLLRRLHMA